MAGNYPDVPSWRMPIDRDGTIGVKVSGGVVTQMSHADLVVLNNENSDEIALGGAFAAFIFPEKRDLDGYFATWNGDIGPNLADVQVSPNSTNGLDGTWTTYSANRTGNYTWDGQQYRSAIVSATALGIKAFRLRPTAAAGGTQLGTMHLYGEPVPGENPHRLAIWHPTLDQRVGPAYFDWGDVPRSSSEERTFRVKNLSPSLTANSIRVAMEALTDTAPSVVGQHALSLDGTLYVAQVNIGALAPGAISSIVRLRRVTPSNAVFGPWVMRTFAGADSWS